MSLSPTLICPAGVQPAHGSRLHPVLRARVVNQRPSSVLWAVLSVGTLVCVPCARCSVLYGLLGFVGGQHFIKLLAASR